MPSATLPTYLESEVLAKNTSKQCWVSIGTNVYDITPFLDDHPGGDQLILDYAGKDVTAIMEDVISHQHTEVAYEIMEEYHIGFVANEKVMNIVAESDDPTSIVPFLPSAKGEEALISNGVVPPLQGDKEQEKLPLYANTGMSDESDLSKDTDVTNDFKTHKFLDLDKPLLMQVWRGNFSKDFYLQQVHRPRHYRGGASAPLFGNFLEPLSLTPWYVIPIVWLPCIAYGLYVANTGLRNPIETAAYFALGLGLWTMIEYGMHRCLFHVDNYLPENRLALTAHFLLHGIHHYLPMDKYRLVMPPTLFVVLATPFWYAIHAVVAWNHSGGTAAFCGGVMGYVCYDLTHYFLHHKTLPAYWRSLKKYHLQHHFADFENGFGVTSRFWDRVFGTELEMSPPKVLKAA